MSTEPVPESASASRKAHLIGICGAGMRSLADYLLTAGWQVTGSDTSLREREAQAFRSRGIAVSPLHQAAAIPSDLDLIVYSLAIPPTNPERLRGAELGIRSQSYVQFLGELLPEQTRVGIAGTHGKTTTTAILAHLLRSTGCDPSVLSGGRIIGETQYGRSGRDSLVLAECCEFQRSFWHYAPNWAALLNVEADHFDCYPDEAVLLAAFGQFCHQIDPSGGLIANGDSLAVLEVCQQARCTVEYFSLDAETLRCRADRNPFWVVTQLQLHSEGTSFTLQHGSRERHAFQTQLFGEHQVRNAVAALLLARQLGVSWQELQQGLKTFRGVERRFQLRGTYQGCQLVDDYAHHPTEIRATIAAARQRFGDVRLTVAFQPHQILRTESLMTEFATAFSAADRVLILPVFAAREVADGRTVQVSQELVSQGNAQDAIFEYCASLDHLRSKLDDSCLMRHADQLDVFMTLGAGDIDRIYYELPGLVC